MTTEFCKCRFPQISTIGADCLACKLPIVGQGDGPKIPLEMVELCRKVLELCKDAGCGSVDLKLDPGWKSSFHGQIQVTWSSGRHGAPSSCSVRTELLTRLEV